MFGAPCVKTKRFFFPSLFSHGHFRLLSPPWFFQPPYTSPTLVRSAAGFEICQGECPAFFLLHRLWSNPRFFLPPLLCTFPTDMPNKGLESFCPFEIPGTPPPPPPSPPPSPLHTPPPLPLPYQLQSSRGLLCCPQRIDKSTSIRARAFFQFRFDDFHGCFYSSRAHPPFTFSCLSFLRHDQGSFDQPPPNAFLCSHPWCPILGLFGVSAAIYNPPSYTLLF